MDIIVWDASEHVDDFSSPTSPRSCQSIDSITPVKLDYLFIYIHFVIFIILIY